MTIEGYEILGCEVARNRYRQREHKGIPIGSKRLARVADIRDAADIGGEDRHTHDPARNGVACGRELISAGALFEERATKHHHTQREDDEYDEINQMHSLPFLMGNASSA